MIWALLACKAEPAVFAASSMTEVASDLGERHGWATVTGGSQLLRFKIEQGAAWRGFISANREHVAAVCPTPIEVARAEVVAVVPQASPVTAFGELERAERVVLGDAAVPIGRYADSLLEREDLDVQVVSREGNVRLVRSKVLLGEADAAIVYSTDLTPELRALPPSPPLAASWWACGDVDVMQALQSQPEVFQAHGFSTP